MPERVRFFNGQFLTAADFEADQKYHIEMRRLHNRRLHGLGIVEGLEVTVGGSDFVTVVVSPGIALDGLGREIIVDQPLRIELGPCAVETCFVTLQYTETATDPVATANGGSEFSRIKEGFSAGTAAEDPGQNGDAQILALSKLIRRNDRWLVDESYCPIRV